MERRRSLRPRVEMSMPSMEMEPEVNSTSRKRADMIVLFPALQRREVRSRQFLVNSSRKYSADVPSSANDSNFLPSSDFERNTL